jgi:hypothetical protein
MGEPLLICDLRPEWRGKPFITFWRPKNSNYAWPLSWAGDYTPEEVTKGGGYYTKRSGRFLIRFAVPRSVAEAISVPAPPRTIDGDAGPVVQNTPENRRALRRAAFIPEASHA